MGSVPNEFQERVEGAVEIAVKEDVYRGANMPADSRSYVESPAIAATLMVVATIGFFCLGRNARRGAAPGGR
jgi:hypothetical protein